MANDQKRSCLYFYISKVNGENAKMSLMKIVFVVDFQLIEMKIPYEF